MALRLTWLAALLAALAVVATASAAPGTTQIRGTSTTLPDEVIGSTYYLRSEVQADPGKAGLDGQWYQPVFDLATGTPLVDCHLLEKTLQCSGTEWFDGFLDRNGNGVQDGAEESGTISFTFKLSTSASGNARCHHPMTSGTGGFAGVTGQLTMKDRVGPCGEIVSTYSGHLALP